MHQKLKYLGINLTNEVKDLYIWKWTRPRIAKTILKKKNILEGLILLDSKTNYKTRVTKCGTGIKARHIDQGNSIESPEINPYINMVNWFFTRVQDHSTNGAKMTGDIRAKECIWTRPSHHIQKLTQNRSKA